MGGGGDGGLTQISIVPFETEGACAIHNPGALYFKQKENEKMGAHTFSHIRAVADGR